MTYKEEEQEYGLVSKMLGSSRVEVQCADMKKRLCLIRGKLKNRVWIRPGDLVLVSLRDFEDDKGDVILKYHPFEHKELIKEGRIPASLKMEDTGHEDSDEDFEFHEKSDKVEQKLVPDSDDEDEEKKKVEEDIDDI